MALWLLIVNRIKQREAEAEKQIAEMTT